MNRPYSKALRSRSKFLDLLVLAAVALFCYISIHSILSSNDNENVGSFISLTKYAKDSPDSVCRRLRFEDIKSLDPLSEHVIDYVRCNHLFAPSNEEYALTASEPSQMQNEIRKMFRNKKHGFFIECGANDGQFFSNTLDLEMERNWTGLLIEADPVLKKKLLGKHRKAWVADVCASPTNSVTEIEFFQSNLLRKDVINQLTGIGRLNGSSRYKNRKELESIGTVKCFPMPTLLAALNVNHVDFLSLDVEGVELKVLKTFPSHDQLSIDIVQVEHVNAPEGKKGLRSYMESVGYRMITETVYDYVFKYEGKWH